MSELPKSFLFVMVFAVLAGGLIIYFCSRRLLFRRHKQRGEESLKRRDYLSAVESFGRAEAVWDFNTTRETTTSYLRDLAALNGVLNGLEVAARAAGIMVAIAEYRDAVKAVQAEFQGKEVGDPAATGRTYASAFMRLKNAQSMLRQQLRATQTRLGAG